MTTGAPKTLPYKIMEPTAAYPVVTILSMISLAFIVADGKHDWVSHQAFSAAKMAEMLHAGNYGSLFTLFCSATGAELSAWMWAANCLFLWVFGSVVEQRLKSLKFAVLMILIVISGWAIIYAQPGFQFNKLYIGPSMMLFGLLGAYFAFLPKRPFEAQTWKKDPTAIFRTAKVIPIHERYFVSPWAYIIAFVLYQFILQAGLNFSKDTIVNITHLPFLAQAHTVFFGRLDEGVSAFNPVAAIANIAVGFVVAHTLPLFQLSMKPKRPGGKLQLEVIQHYRELRTLDMTHEQACEGAAKFAAVPIDTAKDWISKGAAGLKDQNLG